MAKRKVVFGITADISSFNKAMDKVTKKFDRIGRNLSRTGATLTQNITLPLAALGGLAIKSAADFQTLRVSMDTLNGSAEEGARNFERLKKFSARTPFQLQDLAKAQNMLQGFGQSADDAFESITMIGDIAAVSGGDINGIGIAFGQAAAEGRLMTRDIRQLINQGVPAIKLLADTMGVAESEILDLASNGEISFEILQQSFRDATAEGGMFANGMEKQSKTIAGLFSTLKDNVNIALAELGTFLAEELKLEEGIKNLTGAIRAIVTAFTEMSDESRRKILKVALLLGASGPFLFALGKSVKAVGAFVKVVKVLGVTMQTSFAKAVAPILGTVFLLREQIKLLANIAPGLSALAVLIEDTAKNKMADFITSMGDFIGEATGATDAINAFWKAIEEGKNSTGDVFSSGGGSISAPRSQIIGMSEVDANMDALFTESQIDLANILNRDISSMASGMEHLQDVAQQFSNNFAAGLSRLIIEGGKFVDVLKEMGNMILRMGLQKLIGGFLSGGLGGSGFFGSGGGLFGKIFSANDALITSSGDVVKFHPDDNILAMKDFSNLNTGGNVSVNVNVQGIVRGRDIHVSGARGAVAYGR